MWWCTCSRSNELDSPGLRDGRVVIRFLGDDDRRYDVSLSRQALADAIVVLLQGAMSLTHDDRVAIEAVQVQGSFQLAVGPNMEPTLLVGFGGVTLPVHLTETQLATLQKIWLSF